MSAPRNSTGADALLRSDNLRMVGKLVVVAALMFGFGYALVPIYKSICEALGINVLSLSEQQVPGNSSKYKVNTQVDLARTITVEFDANARGVWDFKPDRRSIEVHPGQLTTVMYDFKNIQPRTMAAQAIPSYAPKQAAPYFNKLECFCFTEQLLQPGETLEMPVSFFVDPQITGDKDAHAVTHVTLSYTFYPVAAPKPGVAGKVGGPATPQAVPRNGQAG